MKTKQFLSAILGGASMVTVAAEYNYGTVDEIANEFGADKVNYSGSSGTVSHDITLTTAQGNKTAGGAATTFNIVNADAEVTFAGDFKGSSGTVAGAFVKFGPGSLLLSGSGDFVFNALSNHAYNNMAPTLSWKDGAADWFWNLTVAEGRVKKTGSGAYDAYCTMVGTDQESKVARLDVLNGKLTAGNLLTVGRGSPDLANTNILYVGNSGMVSTPQLYVGIGGSSSKHPTALLDVDGSSANVSVTTKGLLVGNGYASGVVCVRNGASLSENVFGWTGSACNTVDMTRGSRVSVSETGTGSLSVTDGGSASFSALSIAFGGNLYVRDANLKIDMSTPSFVTAGAAGGTARFDGAKLENATPLVIGEMLTGLSEFVVDEGGLEVATDVGSLLDGAPKGSGTIMKKGNGYLALQAAGANVDVVQGSVFFAISNEGTGSRKGVVTAESGTVVGVTAPNALDAMTLVAGEQTNVFASAGDDTHSATSAHDNWYQNGTSCARADGWFRLSNPQVTGPGSVWHHVKMDVSKSFTISFDYFGQLTSTTPSAYLPCGWAVAWQNAGSTALGESAEQCGLGSIQNAFGIGYNMANRSFRYTRQGRFPDDADVANVAEAARSGTISAPCHCIVHYDAEQKSIEARYFAPDGSFVSNIVTSVDLEAVTGSTDAYFGFSAAGSSSLHNRGAFFVGNLRIADGDADGTRGMTVGGVVSIADGKTFVARLRNDERCSFWKMKKLMCGSGTVTLDVSARSAGAKLVFEGIEGSGRIVKTGNATLVLPATYQMKNTVEIREGTVLFADAGFDAQLAFDLNNWWTNPAGTTPTGDLTTPSEGGAIFDANVALVGRTSNKSGHYNDYAQTRMKLNLADAWELTYDLTVSCYSVDKTAKHIAVFFHDDPRGCEATTSNGIVDPMESISRKIGWRFDLNGSSTSAVSLFEGATSTDAYRGMGNVVLGAEGVGSPKYGETNASVRITYRPDTNCLRLEVLQGSEKFDREYSVDLKSALGGDSGHLAFATGTSANWYNVRQRISNLKFSSNSTHCSVGTVSVGPDATLSVSDDKDEKTKISLANVLEMGDGAVIKIVAGTTVTAGRLLSEGTLVVDGGVYEVASAEAFVGVKVLHLNKGAKLSIPSDVEISVDRLYVDGIRVRDASPYVVGGGHLSCVKGLLLIVQ